MHQDPYSSIGLSRALAQVHRLPGTGKWTASRKSSQVSLEDAIELAVSEQLSYKFDGRRRF